MIHASTLTLHRGEYYEVEVYPSVGIQAKYLGDCDLGEFDHRSVFKTDEYYVILDSVALMEIFRRVCCPGREIVNIKDLSKSRRVKDKTLKTKLRELGEQI